MCGYARVGKCGFRGDTCGGVAMSTDREPTEQGFEEDEKNEWGEGVALNCATSDPDGVCEETSIAVEDDARTYA